MRADEYAIFYSGSVIDQRVVLNFDIIADLYVKVNVRTLADAARTAQPAPLPYSRFSRNSVMMV